MLPVGVSLDEREGLGRPPPPPLLHYYTEYTGQLL